MLQVAVFVIYSVGRLPRAPNAAICSVRSLSRAANVVICSLGRFSRARNVAICKIPEKRNNQQQKYLTRNNKDTYSNP